MGVGRPNISDKYRCLFVHSPRTGGNTTRHMLGIESGNHYAWAWYADQFPQEWEKYRTFTVARNPYDRAVSAYHFYDKGKTPSLIDFKARLRKVESEPDVKRPPGWRSQSWYVCRDGAVQVQHVLYYEHLERDIREFADLLGIKELPPLPRLKASPKRPESYRDFYDAELRDMVGRIYKADLEVFWYDY